MSAFNKEEKKDIYLYITFIVLKNNLLGEDTE